jgi:hypothetical protein
VSLVLLEESVDPDRLALVVVLADVGIEGVRGPVAKLCGEDLARARWRDCRYVFAVLREGDPLTWAFDQKLALVVAAEAAQFLAEEVDGDTLLVPLVDKELAGQILAAIGKPDLRNAVPEGHA